MSKEPSEEERQAWQRRLASGANNRAWALAEKTDRSADEDAEMLHAAHASRYLWGSVGDAKNHALADLLLGHVHALLGLDQSALRYAQAALDFFTARDSEPWELAFAHAAYANAAHAAGNAAQHKLHYGKALEVADTMTDPEDRKIFDATFQVIPRPR